MAWKPGKLQLTLSGVMTVATWIWDMWAQAHQIPYECPDWVIGIILAPYGSRIYSLVRDKITAGKPKG